VTVATLALAIGATTSSWGRFAPKTSSPYSPSVHDLLGRELAGRYTIERELGRGGMATV
jgi:hypothetical protein